MTEHVEHRVKSRVERYVTKAFKIFFGAIIFIALILLFGYITMRLWNWLMPEIFGLMTIGYWQALGIIVLAKILFGGFGNHKSGKSERKSKKKCKPRYNKGFKRDFSNWKYYDNFWEEEGEKAFEDYVSRKKEDDNMQ